MMWKILQGHFLLEGDIYPIQIRDGSHSRAGCHPPIGTRRISIDRWFVPDGAIDLLKKPGARDKRCHSNRSCEIC